MDGRLVAAAEEERFTRIKHDPSLPRFAFRSCLEQAGLTIADVDCVAYYEQPTNKLARQIWTSFPGLPKPRAAALRAHALRPELEIREVLGYDGPIEFVEHHQAHAESAFCYSGFEESATLTVDGVGEWATTTYGRADEFGVHIFEQVLFPDSLGLLYSTITSYLGFSVNDGEYKVMGLAPYGKTVYVNEVEQLIASAPGGQFRLNLECFDFKSFDRMHADPLTAIFGRPAREPGSEILEFHTDVARSLQYVLELILLEKVDWLHSKVPSENLCMAGGVALNCVANGRILKEGRFRRLFVQPASGDSGASLGAAAIAHRRLTGSTAVTRMKHAYLGPSFSSQQILESLACTPLRSRLARLEEEDLLEAAVDLLMRGKVIGWFQGQMEFGPRALGARSILADPRNPDMRERINALVKKREGFRPFAPAVLYSKARHHFDLDHPSPFMLETCQVRSTLDLPAITHVDGSARVQTVEDIHNPRFAKLLERFEARTGCPILLNTSFNMRDEPIVCSPVDALFCFLRCDIDALFLEDVLLRRSSLPHGWSRIFKCLGENADNAISHKVYTTF